jgi:[1-hydroxy-2-(trimethylamino)ethyl]phosphonate dioxygenase
MDIDDLFSIYARSGSSLYLGEQVTVAEHGLQSAHFAEATGASQALIVAALLHDIGHLIDAPLDDLAAWESDAHHEISGSRWLAAHFGPAVYEPVRLHVPAKRYLCATDATYFTMLSSASVQTLQLQGGPMSADELALFEAESYCNDAVLLRRCDDQGKVMGLRTAGFEHYRALIDLLTS